MSTRRSKRFGRLRPGRRVILRSTGEKGVVVACWRPWPGVPDLDCWVASFGEEWPSPDEEPRKPYVLRYYETSLAPADGRPFAPAGLVATFAGAKSKKKKKRPRR